MLRVLGKIILYFILTFTVIMVISIFIGHQKTTSTAIKDDFSYEIQSRDPLLDHDSTIYTFVKHKRHWYDGLHRSWSIGFMARQDRAELSNSFRNDSLKNHIYGRDLEVLNNLDILVMLTPLLVILTPLIRV